MNSHIAKPIIVAVFLLTIVVSAIVFVSTQAPQASEITTGGATLTTDTPDAEGTLDGPLPLCSDGLDNDNDGLIDWTGYNAVTGDLGCASPRDETEDITTDQ